MIFILRFVNVVYYVDLWKFHHPGITRKKFHLIMVYDPFNILLNLFYNFVEDFGILHSSGIFGSVQLLSHVRLFGTPWTAARQASLSINNSQSLLKLMSIKLVMPSSHLILCLPLLPPSIFPSISPSSEYSGLISLMDWLDLLAVQGTLKSLLQNHSSKASILCHSAFFTVQLSHIYMTTGKTIALTRWTFVGKVMSLLFNAV